MDSDKVGNVQLKCNMLAFQEVYTKVYKKLDGKEKDALVRKLKKTPFWKLIEAYHKGLMDKNTAGKHDLEMQRLVQCYQPSLNKFKFGNQLSEITVADAAFVLRLPNKKAGLTVPNPTEDPKKPINNPIVQKFFANETKIKRSFIGTCIDRELEEKTEERVDNLITLLILHLFVTLLFANSRSTLGWSFLKCITDVKTMNKYNWAAAVKDYLVHCLNASTKGKSRQISGCVTLIPYWICERTTIIFEIEGRCEMTPGFVKWSLPNLCKVLSKMKMENIEVIATN